MAKLSFDYAKLRVEPRFMALGRLLGGEAAALGCILRFWHCALEYWAKGRGLIPVKIFALDTDWQHLIEVDLAEIRELGVYAKGSVKHFDWILERLECASAGGVASAKARVRKYGSANPRAEIGNQLGTDREPAVNKTGAKREPTVNETGAVTKQMGTVVNASSSSSSSEDSKESSSIPPNLFAEDEEDKFGPKALLDLWNSEKGDLAKAKGVTSQRREKIRTRLREEPSRPYWLDVIKRLAASDHANGRTKNDRFPNGWHASFDWLIANDTNHVKVAEGRYDDRKPKPPPFKVTTMQDMIDAENGVVRQ